MFLEAVLLWLSLYLSSAIVRGRAISGPLYLCMLNLFFIYTLLLILIITCMDSNGHGHDHNGGSCSHSANMEEEEEKHRKEVQTAFANYSKDMKSSFEILFGEQKLIKYYELVRERKREKMEKALQANQAFLNLILDSVHSN